MRVCLIGDHSIFGQGVKKLLAQEDLELVGHLSEADDVEPQIEALRPDVVILVCGAKRQDPSPALMRCLTDGLIQKIVAVSLEDSTLCVYNGYQCAIETIDDFLAEVRQPA